jgi:hypothetical protein
MDAFTTLMFAVFVLQAAYIVYLQYKLNEFKARTVFLQDTIEDMLEDRVIVRKVYGGFQITEKGA